MGLHISWLIPQVVSGKHNDAKNSGLRSGQFMWFVKLSTLTSQRCLGTSATKVAIEFFEDAYDWGKVHTLPTTQKYWKNDEEKKEQ